MSNMDNNQPATYPCLANRTVILAGACGGIGQALAKKFHANGAKLALWDIDKNALIEMQQQYPDAVIVACDLGVESSVQDAVNKTLAEFKKIDVLVQCVGLIGPCDPVIDVDTNAFKRVFDINMMSVFLCNKFVLAPMLENKYGRIVNIASIAGKEGNADMSAYSASKAAVIGFTKSLGKEMATDNITVNCIAPAVIATEMNKQMSPEDLERIVSRIPMQRVGQASEVADLVLWLSSENCSFSTGACFDLSGGRATY